LSVQYQESDFDFVGRLLSEGSDRPVIVGQARGERLFVDSVMLNYAAVVPDRGPATATVVLEPDQPTEPCGSGSGSPATARITLDGDGGVETLTVTARIACLPASGSSMAICAWMPPTEP
jgi:hypothetical protein